MDLERNTFKIFLKELNIDAKTYKFFDVSQLNDLKYDLLPYSIRVLLEAAVRNCDEIQVTSRDVKNLLNWPETHQKEVEVPFVPSRVLLQDFTGVPALIDFAALRSTIDECQCDPTSLSPCCPVDLVMDQSLQIDYSKKIIINQPNDSMTRSCPPPASPNCCLSNLARPASSNNLSSKPGARLRPPTPSQLRPPKPGLTNHLSGSSTSIQNEGSSTNNQPIQIDVGFRECPFHYVRTECADSMESGQELEFERNRERLQFLKWGSKALENISIVPPGNGLPHQLNLEQLTRFVFVKQTNCLIYPDTLVGTDSHTNAVNGTGVLGWTVGGIEAESVMLGQSTRVVLPRVVGYRLTGLINDLCTSTDVVIAITKNLRQIGVVNKFVEFFGPGVEQLSIADRTTIANMCPEYGALVAYFPFDKKTAEYLAKTGRDEKTVKIICEYLKSVHLFKPNEDTSSSADASVVYSEVHELDLSTIVPCVSGPKRSVDKIPMADLKTEFRRSLTAENGFNGFGLTKENANKKASFVHEGKSYTLENGSVVIASITSCTNSSNPSVMLAAALLAQKAVDMGLSVKPYIKTSISPGGGLVTEYLHKSGMIPSLEALGFKIVGYGCSKCIENTTSLSESVLEAIEKNELIAVGVLSGNRNFEGRMHPSTRASYLASPPLVVAYAIAGRVDIDFENEPLGYNHLARRAVYLRDIWPTRGELQDFETNWILPQVYFKVFDKISIGCKQWEELEAPETGVYPWNPSSTYIKKPPFLDDLNENLIPRVEPIKDAQVLLYLGDSITTDHISPAGSIARNSPAARYLLDRGLVPRDFNSYGSRRGNDAVMSRGTFANLRLVNKLMGRDAQPAPRTIFIPTGRDMDVFDASELYKRDATPLIIIAGKEYGTGSPRDWAVKGPYLLGIRAVIAESFDKIHRNNLLTMGIIPLQFVDGENADKLKLSGKEKFTIRLHDELTPKQIVNVETNTGKTFKTIARIDSSLELAYFKNGGMLKYVIRNFV